MTTSPFFDLEFWKAFRKEGLLKYTSDLKALATNDRGGETLGGMSFKRRPDWKGWPYVRDLQAAGRFEDVLAQPESIGAQKLIQFLKDDYQANYWDRPGLDRLPLVLASVAFDVALNQGVAAMARSLQRLLNALNRQGKDYADVLVDGDMGPSTHAALQAFGVARGAEGWEVLAVLLLCCRGTLYLELVERAPEQEDNFYGWGRARVASFFNLK